MDQLNFYHELDTLESFEDAIEISHHRQLPADWWIVVADVIGSTRAIEAGAYKDVNTVGVACIAAVINVDRSVDIPFVFGGDGATFAVPEALRERVMAALREAQRLSRESFGLRLRVGLVRVGELLERGKRARLARVRLSTHVIQPSFSGEGWDEAERILKNDRAQAAQPSFYGSGWDAAERMVKDPQASGVLQVEEDNGPRDGSFEGFECRWQAVPSFQDHKLALLVAAVSSDAAVNLATYRELADAIQRIYGDVSRYHPLRADRMRLSFNPRQLAHEWRVRSSRLNVWGRVRYFATMMFLNLAGAWLFARRIDTQAVRWTRYKADMVENSDFRKFDGMLRMVIDGSEAQYRQLEEYLESRHQAGRLVYGLHKSSAALLTCIVFSYNGNHVHFVDGSEGGYALAARGLKAQLKSLRS